MVYDDPMKVILSQLSGHRCHLITGVVIGLCAGLMITVFASGVATSGIVLVSLFSFLAGSVLSRSLSAYARSVRGDDHGEL